MDVEDENLSDFPDIGRGVQKRLFLRLGSGVNFLQIFKSLSLSTSNMVLMVCGGEVQGLTLMTEHQKCIQGSCHLPVKCFDQVILPENMVRLAISLVDLEEAIAIMPQASIELSIVEEGEPLEVRMVDEGGITVESIIQCFDHENILDFDFEKSKQISRLVIASPVLKSAMENWDVIGISTTIEMNPESPKFVFTSSGVVGSVQIEFTDDLLDSEAPFKCRKSSRSKYQTSFIKNCLRACQYSTHVSFRIDHRGILQVQHLLIFNIADGNQENIFLTFFVNPDFEPSDLDSSMSTISTNCSSINSTAT